MWKLFLLVVSWLILYEYSTTQNEGDFKEFKILFFVEIDGEGVILSGVKGRDLQVEADKSTSIA